MTKPPRPTGALSDYMQGGPHTPADDPSGIRTPDTLIKSQVYTAAHRAATACTCCPCNTWA